MKFLTKINRNYFGLLTLILLLASVGGYFIVQGIIINETKENLLEKEVLIKKQIAETGLISNIYPIVEVEEISRKTIEKPFFKKVLINNESEDELEPYLEFSNQVKINGAYYLIRLRQSTFESEDLVIVLVLTFIMMLVFSFGISFFISKKMNKTVWADFERNLMEIESFSFDSSKNLNLPESDIEEFNRLNKVVNNMTRKLKTDYLSLKEFTENASHEIQTPLSIVLLNLEEILQQELTTDNFKKVISSISAIKRLSSLNQSLLLLTKIENKQFKADRTLIFNDMVKQKVKEFEALFETKKLRIELISESDFVVKMNRQLAGLLVNNLLSNAVNHNIKGGTIQIFIQEKKLKICNTGEKNSLTDDTIFNRFIKGNSKSSGLGLSIVKNICETHDLEIHYMKNELHCFTINPKF
jgi:two-component system OmpR family sensor kinase